MFIVQRQISNDRTEYISAPIGYYRASDGSIVKDGTPSPEITTNYSHVYLFESKRTANRHANAFHGSTVQTAPDWLLRDRGLKD